jgi:UDPglucose 6-dehydrogenase|tara:strand:- start:1166 stop:2002 length:837 start_codon:yes stop_codon:yes gene_type:complete
MVDSIGIVGYGFVGQAIAFGFSPVVDVRVYDKDPLLSMNTLEETINNSDIVFVCVPTPMKPDSSIDLSIVESVFQNIAEVNKNKENVIVLKSTVIPGTTESLSNKYSSLNIVFNPEFLTERKAKFDFLNQSRVILGGDEASTKKVASLYNKRFKTLQIIFSDSKTAELVKYFNNVFFAVKVSFANEMKKVCEAVGADWDTALAGFVADSRVADSHLHVPGPDGKLGFGGTCFPKDLCAFITFAEKLGVPANVIKGAWDTNLEVRPNKDWEKLKGRAVS